MMTANGVGMEMPLATKAQCFATEKHAGQKRKVSGYDYITHPAKVAMLVYHHKVGSKNLDLLCAIAWLHDTREDTETTYEELVREFGVVVADTVEELTNDRADILILGKQEYMEQKLVKLSSYALVVKIADMIANASETPKPDALERMAHHQRFLSGRKLTATQRNLNDELGRVLAAQNNARVSAL